MKSVLPAFIASPMTGAMMEKRAETMDVSLDEAVSELPPRRAFRHRGKAVRPGGGGGVACCLPVLVARELECRTGSDLPENRCALFEPIR